MIRLVMPLCLLLAAPAGAQDFLGGQGAVLRWLDRTSGETADLEMSRGQAAKWGRLTVLLDECRYPVENPAGEAYAHLTIRDDLIEAPVFSGWMIASSPALSALDHVRYDVWVLRCIIE